MDIKSILAIIAFAAPKACELYEEYSKNSNEKDQGIIKTTSVTQKSARESTETDKRTMILIVEELASSIPNLQKETIIIVKKYCDIVRFDIEIETVGYDKLTASIISETMIETMSKYIFALKSLKECFCSYSKTVLTEISNNEEKEWSNWSRNLQYMFRDSLILADTVVNLCRPLQSDKLTPKFLSEQTHIIKGVLEQYSIMQNF